MFVHTWVEVYGGALRGQRHWIPAGARATGSCDLPDMVLGNKPGISAGTTHVLNP